MIVKTKAFPVEIDWNLDRNRRKSGWKVDDSIYQTTHLEEDGSVIEDKVDSAELGESLQNHTADCSLKILPFV